MMEQYNKICLQMSKSVTWSYSTSFTLGIKTLHYSLRDPIYSIYGFVRLADEIVDTFHDFDKKVLLDRFKIETNNALNEGISTNPILQSFQLVVRKYEIDKELIDAFLHSMEMDLFNNTYNAHGYNEYIYGSAEVVGLMCLKVFCKGDQVEYLKLKEPARKLGAAFQKVNFLRDMKSDFSERGRVYFPGVDFNIFNDHIKSEIEKEIEIDFNAALEGIKLLPKDARFGVYVAYIYYQALLGKIKKLPATSIRDSRIRVPNKEKFALLFTSWCKFRLNNL
jgi:phytoene/squalene synthetase